MEELLIAVSRESAAVKNANSIRLLADETKCFTESQAGLLRDPPWQLRARCLLLVQELFLHGSANNRLLALAFQLLQVMLRDDRFASRYECGDDETIWLTNQYLSVLPDISQLPSHCHMLLLKVLLSVASQSCWLVSGSLVVRLLRLCHQLVCPEPSPSSPTSTSFTPISSSLFTAARATVGQIVGGFCSMLDEEYAFCLNNRSAACQPHSIRNNSSQNQLQTPSAGADSSAQPDADALSRAVLVYDDCLPPYDYICSQLSGTTYINKNEAFDLHLSTLLALLNAWQRSAISTNACIVSYTSRHLVPTISSLLTNSVNCTHCAQSASDAVDYIAITSRCKQSEVDATAELNIHNFKLICSVVVEIVRVFGTVPAVRSCLSPVFCRMFTHQFSAERRDCALRISLQLLKSPEMLVSMCTPPGNTESAPVEHPLHLLMMVVNSMTASFYMGEPSLIATTILACRDLLTSLQTLSDLPLNYLSATGSKHLVKNIELLGRSSHSQPNCVRSRVADDVTPVMTSYLSESSLASSYFPESYRCEHLPTTTKHCDTSDEGAGRVLTRDGYESDTSSTLTSGAEEVNDLELGGERSDYRQDCVSDAEGLGTDKSRDQECFRRLERLRDEGFLSRSSDVRYDYCTEQERRNCRHFVRCLTAQLPQLFQARSCLQLDQLLQEFACNYCEGAYGSVSNLSEADFIGVTIVNADGVYLATIAALHLNLSLYTDGYYTGNERALGLTECEFVESVLGSGVLVYLSGSWLAELYQLILSRDLLGQHLTSVDLCDVSSSCALINLLSDVRSLGSGEGGHCRRFMSDYRRLQRATISSAVAQVPPDVVSTSQHHYQTSRDVVNTSQHHCQASRDVVNTSQHHGSTSQDAVKFCRYILECLWCPLVDILSTMAVGTLADNCDNWPTLVHYCCVGQDKSPWFQNSPRAAPSSQRYSSTKRRQLNGATQMALQSLKLSARLICKLDLSSCCLSLVNVLTAVGCNKLAIHVGSRMSLHSALSSTVQIHPGSALSLFTLLTEGLQLASLEPACWSHIIRCCMYVSELDWRLFARSGQTTVDPVYDLINQVKFAGNDRQTDLFSDSCLHVGAEITSDIHDQMNVERLVIEFYWNESSAGRGRQYLTELHTISAVHCLSQLSERLFSDAVHQLNLSCLLSCFEQLRSVSQQLLFPSASIDPTTSSPQKSPLDSAPPHTSHSPTNSVSTSVEASCSSVLWRRKSTRSDPAQLLTSAAGLGSFSSSFWQPTAKLLPLTRLSSMLLILARSGRPLVHWMKVWPVSSQHLVEAACHSDLSIAKRAVTCLHDVASTLVTNPLELRHFHVIEALFKPFETLVSLQLCDTDVEEQIICSVCEFVETSIAEIGSGWRPLFATLRSVRLFSLPHPVLPLPLRPTAHPDLVTDDARVRIILDIFDAFLAANSVKVFARSAVDFIQCLFKLLATPDNQNSTEKHSSSKSSELASIPCDDSDLASLDGDSARARLNEALLRYIKQCHELLIRMYLSPQCPVFHVAHRIQVGSALSVVDSSVIEPHLLWFPHWPPGGAVCTADCARCTAARCLLIDGRADVKVQLYQLDNNSGILRVWLLLIEGLAGATVTCSAGQQSVVMETLFSTLHSLSDTPGVEFAIYCANHLLLPLMQNWLRRGLKPLKLTADPRTGSGGIGGSSDSAQGASSGNSAHGEASSENLRGSINAGCEQRVFETECGSAGEVEESVYVTGIRQACGLATELLVHFFCKLKEGGHDLSSDPGFCLLVRQFCVLLCECTLQSEDTIARLACSCFKHLVTSCLLPGPTDASGPDRGLQWMLAVVGSSLALSLAATLTPISRLMSCFGAGSHRFYGDCDAVRVTLRRDVTRSRQNRRRSRRFAHLTQQVFLLDNQREVEKTVCSSSSSCEDVASDAIPAYMYTLRLPANSGGINGDYEGASSSSLLFEQLVVRLSVHRLLISSLWQLQLVLVRRDLVSCDGCLERRRQLLHSLKNCLPLDFREFVDLPHQPGSKICGKHNKSTHLSGNSDIAGGGKYSRPSSYVESKVRDDNVGSILKFDPSPEQCLSCLSTDDLFNCVLGYSWRVALAFDRRPGLKFLVQKVANFSVNAANLYGQLVVIWPIRLASLLDAVVDVVENTGMTANHVVTYLSDHADHSIQQSTSKWCHYWYDDDILGWRLARDLRDCDKERFLPCLRSGEYPSRMKKDRRSCKKASFYLPTHPDVCDTQSFHQPHSDLSKSSSDYAGSGTFCAEVRTAGDEMACFSELQRLVTTACDAYCEQFRQPFGVDQSETSSVCSLQLAQGRRGFTEADVHLVDTINMSDVNKKAETLRSSLSDSLLSRHSRQQRPRHVLDVLESSASGGCPSGSRAEFIQNRIAGFSDGAGSTSALATAAEGPNFSSACANSPGGSGSVPGGGGDSSATVGSGEMSDWLHPLPFDIEHQRHCSLTQDTEARHAVWPRLLTTLLETVCRQPDPVFACLVPPLFASVRRISSLEVPVRLRTAVALFFGKLGRVYHCSPP